DIAALTSAVMSRLGVGQSDAQIGSWIAEEYALTGAIAGIRRDGMPNPHSLRVASPEAPDDSTGRVAQLAAREREFTQILARPHHRLASGLGVWTEPYPRLRATVRAPFDAIAAGTRARKSTATPARLRAGAIVHLYYEDLWPELRAYLRHIAPLERVYVSVA